MWFESDLLNILIVLVPVLFLMWLDGISDNGISDKIKERSKEDKKQLEKYAEQRKLIKEKKVKKLRCRDCGKEFGYYLGLLNHINKQKCPKRN
jgi:hypothetical protein